MGNEPTVWLVLGDKLGDNAQVQRVAEALDWPTERKLLVFKEPYVIGKPTFKPSLHHVDLQQSDALAPPWPDLVITIGRRPSMIALWIKQQSRGTTKIVLFGRPKRYPQDFDLIVAPSQYLLPSYPNLIRLDLPLIHPDKEAVEKASNEWRERLSGLPRPLVAVMIGGATKPYMLNAEVVKCLLQQLNVTLKGQGTLYFSTSRRTSPDVISALEVDSPGNALLYRYGIDPPEHNPYQALLGLADAFVVTGDSISMLVECVRMKKPLAVFPLPLERSLATRLRYFVIRLLSNGRLGWLQWIRAMYPVRDLEVVHRLLYDRGWAAPLSSARLPFPCGHDLVPNEVSRVVGAIRKMFESECS